jgi:hypothetical protein
VTVRLLSGVITGAAAPAERREISACAGGHAGAILS